jgi:sugar lactone lactonase YvrE
MKTAIISLLAVLFLFPRGEVSAHPGSGIVVDRQGNVYFVDTGSGIWKIDRAGKLTRIPGPAYHWMAIDVDGRLANVQLPSFASGGATVTRAGTNPTLILSSDFPLTVGRDGSLYYPRPNAEGQVQIFRLTPTGSTSVFKTLPPARSATGELRWRNGMVAPGDGALYYTEDRAVRKISPDGELTTVASDLSVPGCKSIAGVETELGPYCRGLDVDSGGVVYVAAAGCRSVLKIGPDGKTTTVLRAEEPWSPTSVALYGADLYVLEYTHTEGDDRSEWLPRVRKVSPDGTVVTVASIDRR